MKQQDALANGPWIICHQTLAIYTNRCDPEAIRPGFYDVRG